MLERLMVHVSEHLSVHVVLPSCSMGREFLSMAFACSSSSSDELYINIPYIGHVRLEFPVNLSSCTEDSEIVEELFFVYCLHIMELVPNFVMSAERLLKLKSNIVLSPFHYLHCRMPRTLKSFGHNLVGHFPGLGRIYPSPGKLNHRGSVRRQLPNSYCHQLVKVDVAISIEVKCLEQML